MSVNWPDGTLLDDYKAKLAEPGPPAGPNDIKDEMPFLKQTAAGYRYVRVLEIGVRTGRSTSAFLAAAAQVGGHVWSIDAAEPDVPSHWHDCRYWDFKKALSQDVAPELEGWPDSYHVVFIDGSHEEPFVLADLRRFVPYAAAGGVVLCHDIRWYPPGQPGYLPVAAALDTFCRETGHTWQARGGFFGLGVIEAPNG